VPNEYAKELLGTLTFDRRPGLWRFISQDEPPDLRDAIFAFRDRQGWTAIVPCGDDPKTTHSGALTHRYVRFDLRVETHIHPVGLGEVIPDVLWEEEISCFFVDGGWASSIFVDESEANGAEALLRRLPLRE
jgi:hypothetical protein